MHIKYSDFLDFINDIYGDPSQLQLHAPVFSGNENKYLSDCIDSTFVSYVGKYVTQFEEITAQFTGAKYAVAVASGTVALQVALEVAGVKPGDEVITQALTFVATPNAISHSGATPVFLDVDRDTLGLSPGKLSEWLKENARFDHKNSITYNRKTSKRISAIVPMHTFGHPCRIEEIAAIASEYNIAVIEDAAESLGSFYKGKHTGTFGLAGILSYNGNKIITTGGGGMIITDDHNYALKAKHITTTAKVSHPWEYYHDEIGYNFRMTNVCASIGVAQMERIQKYLINKRETAEKYSNFCKDKKIHFVNEPEESQSNFWLNAIIFDDEKDRNTFLQLSNDRGIMTRPIWRLMNELQIYENCQHDNLAESRWFAKRVVNVPSGYR